MKRKDPQQSNLNYIGVSSVEEYSKMVKDLGGKVLIAKTKVEGYDFFSVCSDTGKKIMLLMEDDI